MAEKVELDISIEALKKDLQDVRAELSKTGDVAAAEFAQVGAAAKKAGKETEEAFKTGAAQGVADAVEKLQKEYDDLAKSAKTLKSALGNATDPTAVKLYSQSIAQLEAGMQKLEKTGKAAGVNLRDVNKEAGTGRQVFEGMFGAFTKVTLILAAIDAVKKFVSFAVQVADETKKANLQFSSFLGNSEKASKLVSDLQGFSRAKFLDTTEVLKSGKALLAFGESADNVVPVLSRISDIAAATGKDFSELATIYGKARTSGVLYAEDINQLVDAGIPIIQEFAGQLGVSNDQVKKLASEGKISFEELQLAFFNLTKQGATFAGQAETNAETVGGAWKGLLGELEPIINKVGGVISGATTSVLNNLRQFVSDVKTFGGGALFGATTAKGEQAGAFFDIPVTPQGKELEEQKRLEAEAAKRRAELNKKNAGEAAKYARELAQARIAALKDGEEKEVAQEDFRFKELIAQLRKFHLDTTQAEEQHQKNVTAIRSKYEIARIAQREAELRAEQEAIKAGLAQIEQLQEEDKKRLSDNAARNSKAQQDAADLAAATFEAQILAGREIFFQKKRTDEEVKQYEKDVAKARELFQLEQQRAELQRALDFGLTLSSAEKAVLQQRIKNITEQIKQVSDGVGEQGTGGEKRSILDLLGIDPENQDEFKAAVAASIDLLVQLTEARLAEAQAAVDAADAKVAAAEKSVDASQKALDDQLKIAELGFSSNVDAAQKDLAAAKQQQAEAEKQQKQAVANQQKIQKQQIIQDSLLQVSNLATAGTNIFKALSAFGPIGVGLAIASIGLMIGAFVKSKAAALKAVSAQKFRTGGQGHVREDGVIAGPSHEQGGVQVPEYEGGEFFTSDGKRFAVVNRKMTAHHYGLLQAVNKNDQPAMARYLRRITGGVSRDTESTGAVSESVRDRIVFAAGRDERLEQLAERNNRLVQENNRLTQKLVTYEQEREQVTDMGEHYRIVKGGRVTTLRKRG